jgi:hypothetical protein
MVVCGRIPIRHKYFCIGVGGCVCACACVCMFACARVLVCNSHIENASTIENQHVINTNFCHVVQSCVGHIPLPATVNCVNTFMNGLLGFWTSSIVCCSKKHKRARFENLVCFCHQVNGWRHLPCWVCYKELT